MAYSSKTYTENMARAYSLLPVSFKKSVEVCNFVRRKRLEEAKRMLQEVISEKRAVPFRRYIKDLAHRKGTGPARYPKKVSRAVLSLLESAEANAQSKGLNPSSLVIVHIAANKAATAWHYGRQTRRKMKRVNVEVVLEEKGQKKLEEEKAKKR